MRKRKKKELLEIIKTVAEAIDAVQNFIKVQNREEAEALLADCQGAVIGVGTVLEQSGMEGTQAVHFMEELCELIYQCSMTPDFEGKQQICIQIQEKLLQAEKEMEVAIVEQKLVVFLPYKASMWDSLASIWEASKDDGEWESVVMPIPYFAKKADGTLGEMEYEGDEFPADVPIMDWQQFSLEAEHPDIIFIHNPYDQYNYVTTIHPLFYSSKIKNYTDKLVYVPYFVHQNDNVADTYCVLPGTIYADVVVLQSESVREQYIRYFEAGLPDLVKRLGQEVIENKFKAWGSPKFDVGVGNKENVEMPKQWKKLIGEGSKKVVFFNTHLSGLMKAQSEQFLKKLEWVFQFFKAREDVVLLWRPHPLAIQTAQSMNPAAVEPYLTLVEEYKKQGFGIYDDSEDLHRAINIADVYYGDRSSVVELFRQQGKPIMIMDYEVMDE